MTRKEFIKACGILGLNMSCYGLFAKGKRRESPSFSGKVAIIGAGAAGLSAGYLLEQQGIDYIIVEASSQYGGRMKINNQFTDFPISLGAEWISSATLQFGQLIKDQKVLEKIQISAYTQNDEYAIWHNSKLIRGTLDTFNDKKFVNTSWLGFFEDFVLPSIQEKIIYNEPIHSIDYSRNTIVLNSEKEEYHADRVIITVPISLLKNKDIQFLPPLPKKREYAIESITYWDGFKAFFEFKKKFYPSFVDYIIQPETAGQVSLYDAAWGQKSNKNILGLFSVGEPARRYGDMPKETFKTAFLKELDEIFDGKASQNYLNHLTQDWSKERFAKGAYVSDFSDPKTIAQLQESIAEKLFFAGDSYTEGYDWGNVHNAIHSAKQCVNQIINNN